MFSIGNEMKGSRGEEVFGPISAAKKTTGDSVIDAIVARAHPIVSARRSGMEESPSSLTKAVLCGDHVFCANNEVLQEEMRSLSPLLPPLPFNAEEQEQCRQIFATFSSYASGLTVMDMLGVYIYQNLKSFVDIKPQLQDLVNDFCRDWLIIYLSAEAKIPVKTQWSLNTQEFNDRMQRISTELESILTKKEKRKASYTNLLSSIKLLVKAWNSEDIRFLYAYGAGEIQECILWLPPRQQDPKVIAVELVLFIEFVHCAFDQTRFLNIANRDESTCYLGEFKRIVRSVKESLASLPDYLESHSEEGRGDLKAFSFCIETQKKLLKEMRQILRRAEKINEKIEKKNEESSTKKMIVLRSATHLKNLDKIAHKKPDLQWIMNVSRYGFYVAFFENITYILDYYIKYSIPSYITLEARLRRVFVVNTLLHENIIDIGLTNVARSCIEGGQNHREFKGILDLNMTKQKVREKLIDPRIHFLSEKEKLFLYSKISSYARELEVQFCPGQKIKDYITKMDTTENSRMMRRLIMIRDHEQCYPMVKEWLENLYKYVEEMRIPHAQKLMEVIDMLSEETCRAYKTEILEFFEDLLIEQMIPFCLVYMLHQDLHFLTQDQATEEPLPFLETPVAQYIFTQQIEDAVLKKIGETPEEFDASSESEGGIEIEAEEVSGSKKVNLPEDTSQSEACEKNCTLNPACVEKSVAVAPLVIHVSERASVRPKKTVDKPLRFHIGRGEKANRVLGKLRALGLDLGRITGSHYHMKNDQGGRCTLAVHSNKPPTKTVRSGLMKQVNEIMLRETEEKKR